MKLPLNGSTVKMETTPHEVKGIGTENFIIRDWLNSPNAEITYTSIFYVLTMHQNLMSMYRMNKADIHATLKNGF